MIEGLEVKNIEQIYDEMVDAYCNGDYATMYAEDSAIEKQK